MLDIKIKGVTLLKRLVFNEKLVVNYDDFITT